MPSARPPGPSMRIHIGAVVSLVGILAAAPAEAQTALDVPSLRDQASQDGELAFAIGFLAGGSMGTGDTGYRSLGLRFTGGAPEDMSFRWSWAAGIERLPSSALSLALVPFSLGFLIPLLSGSYGVSLEPGFAPLRIELPLEGDLPGFLSWEGQLTGYFEWSGVVLGVTPLAARVRYLVVDRKTRFDDIDAVSWEFRMTGGFKI